MKRMKPKFKQYVPNYMTNIKPYEFEFKSYKQLIKKILSKGQWGKYEHEFCCNDKGDTLMCYIKEVDWCYYIIGYVENYNLLNDIKPYTQYDYYKETKKNKKKKEVKKCKTQKKD